MALEHQEYEGHSIEVREHKGKRELLIDGKAVRYGRLPNGKYAIEGNAYDWSENLTELARRYIDHKRRADKIRRERDAAQRSK